MRSIMSVQSLRFPKSSHCTFRRSLFASSARSAPLPFAAMVVA